MLGMSLTFLVLVAVCFGCSWGGKIHIFDMQIAVQCSTAAVKLCLLDLDLIYKMKLNRGQEMATFKPFLSHVRSYLSSRSCTEMIILGIITIVKPEMNNIRAIFCSSLTSICKYSSLRTLSEIVFLITTPPWVELKEFDVLC